MKSLDQIAEESVSKYVADHKFARLPCAREVLVAMARRGAEAVLAVLDEQTSEADGLGGTKSIDEIIDPATPPAKPQSDNFKSTAWAIGSLTIPKIDTNRPGWAGIPVVPGYMGLLGVLIEALNQAQYGKGSERHNPGGDLPFESQRMQSISNLIGSVDGMTYQACKKITEGVKLPTLERKTAELLGAINYIAGMIVWLRAQAGLPTMSPAQTVKPVVPQPHGNPTA